MTNLTNRSGIEAREKRIERVAPRPPLDAYDVLSRQRVDRRRADARFERADGELSPARAQEIAGIRFQNDEPVVAHADRIAEVLANGDHTSIAKTLDR